MRWLGECWRVCEPARSKGQAPGLARGRGTKGDSTCVYPAWGPRLTVMHLHGLIRPIPVEIRCCALGRADEPAIEWPNAESAPIGSAVAFQVPVPDLDRVSPRLRRSDRVQLTPLFMHRELHRRDAAFASTGGHATEHKHINNRPAEHA
jgi:hypothetical protein